MNAHPRLYKIQDKTEAFEVGVLPDKTQVIIGIQAPNLVIVRFSPQGAFQQIECLPTKAAFSFADAEADLAQWKRQSNFQSAPIAITKFFLQDQWIGIADLPEHYEEALHSPDEFDADRRAELLGDVEAWRERGDFVFNWAEDYYLNAQGEIVSS